MTRSGNPRSTGKVVHDIKQMLMVITGRAGLLLERGDDHRWRPHLQAIELAATDAAAMLARLAQDERVGQAPVPASNLRFLVEQSTNLILPPGRLSWAGADDDDGAQVWKLVVEVGPEVQVSVRGQVVREVLNNLLVNALAVMPAGGTVFLKASTAGPRVVLDCADTGPGVPQDQQARIFEWGVTGSGEEGRGLGLATSRELLEQAGGQLTLAEAQGGPGGGAVFRLEMPRAQDVEPSVRATPPVPAHTKVPRDILVVDDDPAVTDMLGEVLEEIGWRPQVLAGGDQAIEEFVAGKYTVAFLDQNLPGMSGLEIARHLRDEDPDIVLILVTGWDSEDITARALDHGCDFAEEKPLTVGKIRQILNRAEVLGAARQGQENED
nr:response regulator [Candidatus Krumholzibacteria bacterium]